MSTSSPPYPDLLDVLEVVPGGVDTFTASSPPGTTGRLFGGQLVAQALRAACLTAPPGCRPYQLHAQFLRAGRPHEPLTLRVSRPRDGRAFANRRVEVEQYGKPLLALLASFHVGEPGDDWQPPHDTGPHPDSLPHWPSPLHDAVALQPFEIRPACPPDATGKPALHPLWIRTRKPVSEDATVHACVQAFVSDAGLALSGRWHRAEPQAFTTTSLDHTVWFHRPARTSDWLLLSTTALSVAEGRCLVHGTMHTPGGTLVASIAQVALVRPLAA
ncbi:MAG TPA: acyl-CoA thioesterase domain-containing protein [Amycolatopsis sp.]|nr:acyl-CoA thioesterase domain-containing protein [Amycolatopsis sp.]